MKLFRKISEWRRYRGFFDGMTTVLNVFPATKPATLAFPFLLHSDTEAIAGDWAVVSADINRAMTATVGHPTKKENLPNSERVLTHAIKTKLHGAR